MLLCRSLWSNMYLCDVELFALSVDVENKVITTFFYTEDRTLWADIYI